MAQASIFEEILDYANRADPYRLYAELRKTPVARQEDGTYVVSTYREIVALLHDSRVSSDRRDPTQLPGTRPDEGAPGLPPSFIGLDPPEHDRIRRLMSRHFGPAHSRRQVGEILPEMVEIVNGLIDGFTGKTQVDLVDDFAYPFPVMVICRLLGVPREDEPRVHVWSDEALTCKRAFIELSEYLADLAEVRGAQSRRDILTGLITDDGRMSREELMSNTSLLLLIGHETTANLIVNGMLTLLRHPDVLDRLRHPRYADLADRVVEELLRYEPPVQLLPTIRRALDDIDIAGTTIPRGAAITLVFAAGNRDPEHFPDPDRFDPDRQCTNHLSFGGGIHYCFGAPLARWEARVALTGFARRLQNPRLIFDPPPYREDPILRSPQHLVVEIDRVVPTRPTATSGIGGPREPDERSGSAYDRRTHCSLGV